jgi:hypothetical protein
MISAPLLRSTSAREKRLARNGSITLAALLSLVVLAVIAGSVLRTTMPRFHVTHHTAGWQEARLAAEAGVDLALDRLNRNTPNPALDTADWRGWRRDATTVARGSMLARSNSSALTGLTAPGNAITATPSIFLDNVNVSPTTGIAAAADVQLCALYPSTDPTRRDVWFRIRSMGTSAVPGPRRAAIDRMDTALRRLSLGSTMRPTLRKDDVLVPTTVPFPNASRIVEVLAKPILPFARAILTDGDMELGSSSGWQVNSYHSGDPEKRTDGEIGFYPGDSSPKIQGNGDIASNLTRSDYGPLIQANGAVVLGEVSTNGGDDPATTVNENVANSGGIDPARIRDDFEETMEHMRAPVVGTDYNAANNPNYANGHAFSASGSPTTEVFYRISSTNPPLGAFRVTGIGRITIVIEGDWNIGSGEAAAIEIPPTVQATIFVKGNIDFNNGMVNTTPTSSNRATNLMIYGVPDPLPNTNPPVYPTRTLNASGNPHIAAAFYGPSYNATVSGTAEWYGAVVSKSYFVNGGGSGGFHYDEALGSAGAIRRFEITSYFEDSRQ